MAKSKKVWVVITTESSDTDDSDRILDVVLVTTDKKKAERCVKVLIGDKYTGKVDRDALLAKDLKEIKGAVSYELLTAYESAGLFSRPLVEE